MKETYEYRTRENAPGDLVAAANGLMIAGNLGALKELSQSDRNLYRLSGMIEKAAASTDSLTDLGVAFDAAEGFLSSLDMSALDSMRARPAPLYTPLLNLQTAVQGIVAEHQKMPIVTSAERLSLVPAKTGGICVATRDQLRSGIYGESMLGLAMRNGISSCSNRALVELLESDAGTVTITATGTTGAAILADIGTASAAFELDSQSRLYLLASPQDIKNLSLKNGSGVLTFPNCGPRGGEILPNVEAIACPGFPDADSNGNYAMLIDSGGLLTNTGALYISASESATLEMLDPDGGAGTIGVSLFQEDLVALRYVRTFAVKPLRACVAKISAVNW